MSVSEDKAAIYHMEGEECPAQLILNRGGEGRGGEERVDLGWRDEEVRYFVFSTPVSWQLVLRRWGVKIWGGDVRKVSPREPHLHQSFHPACFEGGVGGGDVRKRVSPREHHFFSTSLF